MPPGRAWRRRRSRWRRACARRPRSSRRPAARSTAGPDGNARRSLRARGGHRGRHGRGLFQPAECAMAQDEKPSPSTRSQPPTSGGPTPFGGPPSPPPPALLSAGLVTQTAPAPAGRTAGKAQAGNLLLGFMAGLVAAAVGAALWATITVVTNYQIGWIAIGGRAPRGPPVRAAGQGASPALRGP